MNLPNRRTLCVLSATSLAVTGLLVANGPAQSATVSQPVLATGTITFPAGASTGQVLAFADPSPATINKDTTSTPLPTTLVSTAQAAGDGSFSLAVDPAAIPSSTKLPDGSVNIEAVAVSGGQQQVFFFPASLIQTSAGPAFVSVSTSTKPQTPNLLFNMASGTTVNAKYSPAKFMAPSGRLVSAAKAAATTRSRITPASPKILSLAKLAATDVVVDAPDTCDFIPGTKYFGRPEHFVNVYTDNNDTASAHVSESSTATHTLGVGITRNGGASWSVSGSSSITRSSTTGVTSANRTRAWGYWNKVNYQDMRNTCGYTIRKAIGFYDMISADIDGSVAMIWLTTSCGRHAKGDQWDTGGATAATFSGGVDIGPINVSAQTGFATSENVHYTFLKAGSISGNDTGGPVQSSKVEVDEFACV